MESRYTWKNQLLIGVRSFAIAAAVILVLIYLVVTSGQAAKRELETFVEEKKTVTIVDEPVVYGYENGAKVWELRSEVARQEKETESSDLTRIYELILFKGGEENVIIRGDHGEWDKPHERLTLTGNVEVESADGTTWLDTEKLTWEEEKKVLSCPVPVDFRVEDNHIVANSLYSDDDLVTIDFIGKVEMFIVGLEGENFVTREGEFPIEEVEGEEKSNGMNVLASYVHYDKGDRACQCYPYIPLNVRSLHNLDENGRELPGETRTSAAGIMERLNDPAYVEALEKSVAQMDLSPEELAFLRGETNSLLPAGSPFRNHNGPDDTPGAGQASTAPGESASVDPNDPELMGGRTSPMGGAAGSVEPGSEGGRTSVGLPGQGLMGPDISGAVSPPGDVTLDLPSIPRSDPEKVLTAPDYSGITDWRISPDLYAESFEGNPDFSPSTEMRDGLVFCYRENKKIWCEELHIDLGEHRVEALRQADARFQNLEDTKHEPPKSRAAQAIRKTPTQFIGNYLVHNWRENITEGYGRVLVMQPEKDIEANNVVYSEDSDMIQAWGDVIVHQFGGGWWVSSGAIEEVSNERAREDVRNPSVVTADAILSYSRKVSWAFGNVVFRQEEQVIKGDRAQYEENTEILVMAGSVDYGNEDGEKLSCALLTLDLMLEEYIAEGAAVARNIVPEEYRENLKEFRKDEDKKPEDDARARLLEKRTAEGLGNWTEEIESPPGPPPIEYLPESQAQSEAEKQKTMGPEVPSPFVPAEGEGDTGDGA